MAECFCGCGRTVRFAKKRFSKWGAETDEILEVLEGLTAKIVRHLPEQTAKVNRFIEDGREFRAFWVAMAHGDRAAPPVAPGLSYREAFFHWRDNARGLAAATVRALRDAEVASKETERAPGTAESIKTADTELTVGSSLVLGDPRYIEGEPGEPDAHENVFRRLLVEDAAGTWRVSTQVEDIVKADIGVVSGLTLTRSGSQAVQTSEQPVFLHVDSGEMMVADLDSGERIVTSVGGGDRAYEGGFPCFVHDGTDGRPAEILVQYLHLRL